MISKTYNASTSDMKFCSLLMLNDFIIQKFNEKIVSRIESTMFLYNIKSNDGF